MHVHGSERSSIRAIPYSAVNPLDNSLLEWPKDKAVLWPLSPQSGEAVFGDVYMAWDERGLSLATIAMDYYDPALLAYEGNFPRTEAFQIHLGIDAGAGPRTFRLEVEPVAPLHPQARLEFRARLCEEGPSVCTTIPGADASYFGVAMDQPRVIAESKLPWYALGIERPPARVKAEISVTAFHQSRWMSLSGLPPAQGMADQAAWTVLPLTP